MIRLVCSEGDFTGEPFEESPAFPIDITVREYYELVQHEAEAHLDFACHLWIGDARLHHKNKENA